MPDGESPAIRKIVLRPYQWTLMRAAYEASRTHRRVCIYGPTGSGKTEQGMYLVQQLLKRGQRVTWCVNRIDLIQQTSDRFLEHGLSHGVLQAKHERTDPYEPTQIASIQTINRRKFNPGLDVIIIDEAHGAIAPMYRKFLTDNPVQVYGLTATPFSRGLGKVFDTLVHTETVTSLTDGGWLVPARYFAPDRPDLSKVHTLAGDWNELELESAVNRVPLVANLCDEWMKRANGGRTIVFATSIAHSKHICEQFNFRRIPTEHIDCNTKPQDRIDILDRLRSGQTKVVTNCAVLAEGFNLPALDCIVLARPTQSLTRYVQMAGRALRPAPGKSHALILDHSDTVERLGFLTDPMPLKLDMGEPKKKTDPKLRMYLCPKCKAVTRYKPTVCVCGYTVTPPPFSLEQQEGTLHELKREVRSHAGRQLYYSGLISICLAKQYKPGWAGWAYKQKFGRFPEKDLHWFATAPTSEVKNDVLAARIRRIKAREKQRKYA
jgi:superfamily II DNA or RNA helicase